MPTDNPDTNLIGQMFMAYVSNNTVDPSQVENVVRSISRGLSGTSSELSAGKDPAVPVSESISLKRHLGMHGLTPDEYRSKWGLPKDYPMVAPKYAKARSRLAKKIGLGRKRKAG
jgi:predicted transcriptional regulator